jgi:hypothetical protein
MEPLYAITPTGKERISFRPVLNHGNCVRHAGEVHSTEQEIFVWQGNGLRRVRELDTTELAAAKAKFDEAWAHRKTEFAK